MTLSAGKRHTWAPPYRDDVPIAPEAAPQPRTLEPTFFPAGDQCPSASTALHSQGSAVWERDGSTPLGLADDSSRYPGGGACMLDTFGARSLCTGARLVGHLRSWPAPSSLRPNRFRLGSIRNRFAFFASSFDGMTEDKSETAPCCAGPEIQRAYCSSACPKTGTALSKRRAHAPRLQIRSVPRFAGRAAARVRAGHFGFSAPTDSF
jgi:hypothetical protein